MIPDPQTQMELDVLAYVNGQLDGERRFAVAEYLSRHPDRAAEVMAELRLTEGLRLAVSGIEAPPPPQLRQAAERLSAGLAQRHLRRRWLPFMATAAAFALGWMAQGALHRDEIGRDIAAVMDTAMDVQDAVVLRSSLGGAPGSMPHGPEQIAARLGIDLPRLPQGWVIRAADVVATPERPGVALVIDTPEMGEILLFGVLRSVDGPDGPATATARNGRALAFFERDRTAFVLVDSAGSPAELRRGAEALRHRFN